MMSKKMFNFKLDILIGILCLLTGGFIVAMKFAVGLDQFDIGTAILLGSALYFLMRNKTCLARPAIVLSRSSYTGLNILFYIVLFAAVYVWYVGSYDKPFSYFVFISLLAGLVSLEILSLGERSSLFPAFIKIFLLGFFYRFSIFYNYPSLQGFDAYWHAKLINILSQTATIPPFDLFSKYTFYPLYHIFIALAQIICQVNTKDALFISVIFANIIMAYFVFSVAQGLSDRKVGLIALLIINTADTVITNNLENLTPSALVFCYFLMILYFMLRGDDERLGRTARSLSIFMAALIVLTHQLSAFASLVSIFFIFLGGKIGSIIQPYFYDENGHPSAMGTDVTASSANRLMPFEDDKKAGENGVSALTRFSYIALFTISMQYYWMRTDIYEGKSFFNTVMGNLIKVLTSDREIGSDAAITVSTSYSMSSNILFHLGYLVLIFFAMGGIIAWLSSRDLKKMAFCSALVGLYFMIYAVPLMGVRNMLPGRWFPFAYIFLIIIASDYLIGLSNLFKSNATKNIFVFCLISLITFLMITTPNIDKDNPLYAQERAIRDSFTDSEIDALKMAEDTHLKSLLIDRSYSGSILREMNLTSRIVPIGSDQISNNTSIYDENRMVVLRRTSLSEPVMIENRSMKLGISSSPLTSEFFGRFNDPMFNQVYDNGNNLNYFCA